MVEELSQEIVQLEDVAIGLHPADQQLAAVEPLEQPRALLRADHGVGQVGADLRQQVELQQHVLVGAGQGVEEVPAEHVEQSVLAAGKIVVADRPDGGAPLRQQHEPDGPAARGGDVDRAAAFRSELDQAAGLRLREGDRGLIDDDDLVAQRKVAQFLLRQGAGQAHATNSLRQLVQHHGEHAAKVGGIGIVKIVERQDRARLQMLEIGAEEPPGELAGPLRIFRAEYRHPAGNLGRPQGLRQIVIEARDVLVALVDAEPDIGRVRVMEIVDQGSRLAIARRGGEPADANAQRFLDQLMDARTPDGPGLPGR